MNFPSPDLTATLPHEPVANGARPSSGATARTLDRTRPFKSLAHSQRRCAPGRACSEFAQGGNTLQGILSPSMERGTG